MLGNDRERLKAEQKGNKGRQHYRAKHFVKRQKGRGLGHLRGSSLRSSGKQLLDPIQKSDRHGFTLSRSKLISKIHGVRLSD